MKRVRLKSPTTRGVPLAPPKSRAVAPAKVAVALGADAGGNMPVRTTPLALRAIRAQLFNAMRSSGGRPKLEGTARRQKVPMRDEDWQTLELLSGRLGPGGPAISAGQLAAQLLRNAIGDLQASVEGTQARGPLRVSEPAKESYQRSAVTSESARSEGTEALISAAEMLRAEGRAEGRAEARVEVLLHQCELKFGKLPSAARARLAKATVAELHTWAERVLTASSLDEVLE